MNYKGPNKIIYQDYKITKILIESPKYGDFECIVDTKNYFKIKDFRFKVIFSNNTPREICTVSKKGNKKIHSLIMGSGIIDHKDGNIFNNIELNLRECSFLENGRNKKIPLNNTSGYKGVKQEKRYNKWVSRIITEGKEIYLGTFDSKDQAAIAYNKAALKYHGEFAKLNNIMAAQL